MTDPQHEINGWTIYDRPIDYPASYVARKWVAIHGTVVPTTEMFVGDSVDEVRALLPPGLIQFPRHPSDDAKIVECWL